MDKEVVQCGRRDLQITEEAGKPARPGPLEGPGESSAARRGPRARAVTGQIG